MNKKFRKKIRKFFQIAMPVWLVFVLILNSVVATGLVEYYFVKKNFNTQLTALAKSTKNPEELVQILKSQVLPQTGYVLGVTWKDIGKQLLDGGAIDKQKYEQLLAQEPGSSDMMKYLNNSSNDRMMINEKNSHFMVNTLWALGLANKSKVLEEGTMKTYGKGDVMSFASTGGWSLGKKPTGEIYSSSEIVKLTPEQNEIVKNIAQNVYRPCCGNSTEFPDCNHGMAALGYIEAAVKQGLSEKRIYQDVLALNSFWFPQQYVTLAAYFNQQKTDWTNVDAKVALGVDYSSGQGAARIAQAVQNVPGVSTKGGGCGA